MLNRLSVTELDDLCERNGWRTELSELHIETFRDILKIDIFTIDELAHIIWVFSQEDIQKNEIKRALKWRNLCKMFGLQIFR